MNERKIKNVVGVTIYAITTLILFYIFVDTLEGLRILTDIIPKLSDRELLERTAMVTVLNTVFLLFFLFLFAWKVVRNLIESIGELVGNGGEDE